MLISEIFYSLQGEGALAGVPSVFIRTSGCNLRCAWCDTPYASWNPEGEQLSPAEIVERVLQFPAKHVVITGGEPMIAPGMPVLAELLHAGGMHITMETAGTVPPAGIACDFASLSPKLQNSTPAAGTISSGWIERHEATRKRPEILSQWIAGYDYQLKFVLSGEQDLMEIETLVAGLPGPVPAWKIQLMPEGRTVAEIDERARLLVALCKEKGYRFSDRLHLRLFGNTRGT